MVGSGLKVHKNGDHPQLIPIKACVATHFYTTEPTILAPGLLGSVDRTKNSKQNSRETLPIRRTREVCQSTSFHHENFHIGLHISGL